jgi:hypothetical protein
VNGIPATVMLVSSYLSLSLKARRLLCAAVYSFVRKPDWPVASNGNPANLVHCYLKNY